MSSISTIIAGGLIGLGVAAGGLFAGESLVKSRLGYRVVTGTYSKIPLKPPAPPAAKP